MTLPDLGPISLSEELFGATAARLSVRNVEMNLLSRPTQLIALGWVSRGCATNLRMTSDHPNHEPV